MAWLWGGLTIWSILAILPNSITREIQLFTVDWQVVLQYIFGIWVLMQFSDKTLHPPKRFLR